jgi:hypothetical protein
LITQLGVVDVSTPSTILSDSQGSIALGKNPEYHSRTKHIDIQHHYVREQVLSGVVTFSFVSTSVMAADVLTKPLTKDKHRELIKLMGIKSISSGSVGEHRYTLSTDHGTDKMASPSHDLSE